MKLLSSVDQIMLGQVSLSCPERLSKKWALLTSLGCSLSIAKEFNSTAASTLARQMFQRSYPGRAWRSIVGMRANQSRTKQTDRYLWTHEFACSVCTSSSKCILLCRSIGAHSDTLHPYLEKSYHESVACGSHSWGILLSLLLPWLLGRRLMASSLMARAFLDEYLP